MVYRVRFFGQCSYGIGLGHHDQRLPQAHGQALLRPPGQIEPELAVHAPEPLVIPGMPIELESITTLPEPPATLGGDERGQRRDHRGIPPGPIHERPIVGRPSESHCATGPLNRKAAHGHQVRGDLPPFSRP